MPVAGPPIEDVIDVGDAKPERFYDAYLSAALNDIQTWWSQQFPLLFGDAYVPLEGGIYAAYPERTTPIPGCSGTAQNSTYQDVVDAGAFYCPNGDFMAYDDGEDGVIFELAEAYGPSIVAVVMAHEFGHAIQARVGTLNQDVPTVYTEQQADCYSGAWSRRAWNGEATGVPFTDGDIELGMIALVEVRDPVGTDVLEPGGHGSAFDRIGAFQEGFYYGVGACADLIDHPLPLQENEFDPAFDDALTNGNAPFGFEEREIFRILNDDLTSWWPAQLAPAGRHDADDQDDAGGRPGRDQLRRPAGAGQLRRALLRGDERGALRPGVRPRALRRLRRLRRRLRHRARLGRRGAVGNGQPIAGRGAGAGVRLPQRGVDRNRPGHGRPGRPEPPHVHLSR